MEVGEAWSKKHIWRYLREENSGEKRRVIIPRVGKIVPLDFSLLKQIRPWHHLVFQSFMICHPLL
jgi:hypothetical protein